MSNGLYISVVLTIIKLDLERKMYTSFCRKVFVNVLFLFLLYLQSTVRYALALIGGFPLAGPTWHSYLESSSRLASLI